VVGSNKTIIGIRKSSRLSLKNGTLTLFVPYDKPKQISDWKVACCSMDPGERTFQTIYCDNGDIYSIGNNVSGVLSSLIEKIHASPNKRHQKRLRDKIRHKVEDLHWKAANQICRLSYTVIVGKLSTQSILQGNLSPMTKNVIQCLSHFTFRQRLKSKCEEYGLDFHEVDESYTTMTCGNCGKHNLNVGSKKIFKCPTCKFTAGRDVNAARNIMIKTLEN
jgi:IS605 OrfB family transposase